MSIFGKIFGGLIWIFALIFRGRTGEIIAELKPVAQEIVATLMDSDLPGAERFKVAFQKIKEAAIEQGIETADHAIEMLIEFEVTKANDDPLEKIFDEGLESARKVIQSINASDLAGNAERKAAAVEQLTEKLKSEGKEWLLSTRTLNLLIAAAVSSFKI